MPELGSIHAIALQVCGDHVCDPTAAPGPAERYAMRPCSLCLERARRAVREMREIGLVRLAQWGDDFQLAATAHRGQVDKAGASYLEHISRVGDAVATLAENDRRSASEGPLPGWSHWQVGQVLMAAHLHDLVEDTPYTLDDLLLHGFSDDLIEMVRLLTKPPGDTRTYDQRITDLIASGNVGAILIKLADVEDNGDPARLALLPKDQRGIGERYQRARARLHEAATALGWQDPREQAESAA